MSKSLDTAAKSPTKAALERTIAMMIREARIDPCAFVRMILMGAAWDPLPEIHRGLQNHLSAHRLALVELPRDHGKTPQVCLRAFETKTPGRRNSDPARGIARSITA